MDLLAEQPLLLLFVVAAVGTLLGHIHVAGVGLGPAAVLFAGLLAGGLDGRLVLPELVQQLGLVLFVYTIGLSSGPAFFAGLARHGVRDATWVAVLLTLPALLAGGLGHLLGLRPAEVAGVLCGGLTNTPALAAAVEQLANSGGAGLTAADRLAPVVAYSLTYPAGVLGAVLAVVWLARRSPPAAAVEPVETRTVQVTQPLVAGERLVELQQSHGWQVVFGRLKRAGHSQLVHADTELQLGDSVTVVGQMHVLQAVAEALGQFAAPLELDRTELDFRRVFVSAPDVLGRTLSDLDLDHRFGAQVTRVRRGDVELLATPELILQPGDRVRVVAPRTALPAVARFLGDSYRALAEVDIVTVGIGIALGIALGQLAVSLGGGVTLQLGLAGGPLVVGLLLGRLGRTGQLLWTMPYSANLTLRQLGLVLFFAGVGTRAGAGFAATVAAGTSGPLLVTGAAVTLLTAGLAASPLSRRWLGVDAAAQLGRLAGLHTQPAALAVATDLAPEESVGQGYAAVFPLATLGKILVVEVLLVWLGQP